MRHPIRRKKSRIQNKEGEQDSKFMRRTKKNRESCGCVSKTTKREEKTKKKRTSQRGEREGHYYHGLNRGEEKRKRKSQQMRPAETE